MISLQTGKDLKAAGLVWRPEENDFFAIPDRGLDSEIFVLSQLLSFVEQRQGRQMVTFHGTAEWALDSLVLSEAIWLPTESQLRGLLIELLHRIRPAGRANGDRTHRSLFTLDCSAAGTFRLAFAAGPQQLVYEADQAEEAYAAAIIALLTESGI